MAIIEHNDVVNISKVNSKGLITNKGMLELLENTACLHSDKAGYGILDIPKTHLSWVQLNWNVKVLRRLVYGEHVTIRTWARTSTKVSTLRDFEVLDKDNNVVCIATTRWTLTNIDTLSITKITDELIEKYNLDEFNNYTAYYYLVASRLHYETNEEYKILVEFFEAYTNTYNMEKFYFDNTIYFNMFYPYKIN